jgi:hypothetical protein
MAFECGPRVGPLGPYLPARHLDRNPIRRERRAQSAYPERIEAGELPV